MKLFKVINILLASLLLTSLTIAQDGKIYVEISGIEEVEGEISIGLFDDSDKENFPKNGKVFMGKFIKIVSSNVNFTFENIPNGDYAIAVYHDENSNKELDRNFLGIPSEDYVFSNYASGGFGPPSFDDAMFTLTDSIKIKLNINE